MKYLRPKISRAPTSRGITLVETIVTLVIIAVLILLAVPALDTPGCGSPALRYLSNMRQLHVVAQQMTLDLSTTGDPRLLDFTCSVKGNPVTLAEWKETVVRAEYLSANDVQKLFSAAHLGNSGRLNTYPDSITLYAVQERDKGTAVFASTCNWHGLSIPTSTEPPFKDGAFAIFRKGGDGQILRAKQYSQASVIGTGGKYNYLRLEP